MIANKGTFVCLMNEGECRFDILSISCLLISFCMGVRLFDNIPFTVFLLGSYTLLMNFDGILGPPLSYFSVSLENGLESFALPRLSM